MDNLRYCRAETRRQIEAVLNSLSTRRLVMDTLTAGLNRDALDAARDARLVADLLQAVADDVVGKAAAGIAVADPSDYTPWPGHPLEHDAAAVTCSQCGLTVPAGRDNCFACCASLI